ncbi:hypothetical protein CBL_08781 [Carabus blaptoides fortunei]
MNSQVQDHDCDCVVVIHSNCTERDNQNLHNQFHIRELIEAPGVRSMTIYSQDDSYIAVEWQPPYPPYGILQHYKLVYQVCNDNYDSNVTERNPEPLSEPPWDDDDKPTLMWIHPHKTAGQLVGFYIHITQIDLEIVSKSVYAFAPRYVAIDKEKRSYSYTKIYRPSVLPTAEQKLIDQVEIEFCEQ